MEAPAWSHRGGGCQRPQGGEPQCEGLRGSRQMESACLQGQSKGLSRGHWGTASGPGCWGTAGRLWPPVTGKTAQEDVAGGKGGRSQGGVGAGAGTPGRGGGAYLKQLRWYSRPSARCRCTRCTCLPQTPQALLTEPPATTGPWGRRWASATCRLPSLPRHVHPPAPAPAARGTGRCHFTAES